MPQRTVLETVVLRRSDLNKGKPFSPPIGKNFNFTAAEIKQLEEVRPQAIGPRSVEFVEDDEAEVASVIETAEDEHAADEAASKPASKPTAPKAATPKPTSAKAPAKDDDL